MSKITKKDRITHLELQVGWLTNVVHELRGTENLEFEPQFNSLIERETAELTGSDLCEVIIVTMQKYQPCYISDISDEHALKNKVAMLVDNIYTDGRDYKFRSNLVGSRYAVPINNQGEPLTASEVGL